MASQAHDDTELYRRAIQRAEEVNAMRRAGIVSSDEHRYNEGRKHWDECDPCRAGNPCPIGESYL